MKMKFAIAVFAMAVAAPAWSHEEPAPEEDPRPWDFSAAVGISLRDGDQSKFNGNADIQYSYSFPVDTFGFRALGDYGESDGDRDTENYFAGIDWRHDFTERFFWQSIISGDSDQIQGRNFRFQTITGPGYRVWAQDTQFLDLAAGVGYRHERFREPTPNNDLVDATAGWDYYAIFGEVLELSQTTDFYAPVNDIENFLAKAEATLSVPVFEGLHFRNNARYEFVNQPAEGRKSSNVWLTMGLEYRL